MHPPLVHVDTKIERAKQHIRDFEAAIKRLAQSNPYEVVAEDDPNTGVRRFRIHVVHDVPAVWGAIVGDVVHNLRSSLDVLIWQLVQSRTRQRPGRHVKFPFADTREEFESKDLRKIQRASNEAVSLLKAIKPYKGGNDALWTLHTLDVADKHHLLIPVGTVATSRVLSMGGAPFIQFPGKDVPLEEGAVVLTFVGDRESYMDVNTHLTLQIAFGKGEILEGQAVLPTLVQLCQVVEGTIQPFRALFP